MTSTNHAQQTAQSLQAISPPDAAQQLQFLSLPDAARILPTQNGKRISTATLWRWISKGMNGQKLKHYRFGKRIAVTLPDLIEFGAAVAEAHAEKATITPAKPRRKSTPALRTDEQRTAAASAAIAELRNAGLA